MVRMSLYSQTERNRDNFDPKIRSTSIWGQAKSDEVYAEPTTSNRPVKALPLPFVAVLT